MLITILRLICILALFGAQVRLVVVWLHTAGHQSVIRNSLVMLIPLLSSRFLFDLSVA